jgi:RNA polymerase sigma factor (sigma-70 family)
MYDSWSIAVDGMGGQAEQDRSIAGVVQREGRRLFRFIRTRVKDRADAEDILQEVFYELTEAYRLAKPIEEAGAWLFRVARNRIIDGFRKKKPEAFGDLPASDESGLGFEDLLPSPDAGPDAEYIRGVLLDELEAALEELPREQREAFVGHEMEGRSFKELAEKAGVGVNTMLARKRYAVLHLRRRLAAIHEEFGR